MLDRARRQLLKSASRLGLKPTNPPASTDLSASFAATSAQLPFADAAFPMVLAPYGILQSLIRPRDLTATLASVARVLTAGGTFGIDLVPGRAEVARIREPCPVARPRRAARG